VRSARRHAIGASSERRRGCEDYALADDAVFDRPTPRRVAMLQISQMDDRVTIFDQLAHETGPLVLVNTFKVAPEDADALLEAWAADAAYLKQKPGFISTQLHRGVAGSTVFFNYAVWESMEAFRAAFGDPQFQATFERYPDSTVASPHVFQKVAVAGICVDR
jgi:heme-degrading monooxygenase HmoA